MGWPVPALHNYLHLQARRAGAQSTKFTASCGAAFDDCFSKRASTVILRQCLVNDGSSTRRAHMRVERVLLSGVEHGGASNGFLHGLMGLVSLFRLDLIESPRVQCLELRRVHCVTCFLLLVRRTWSFVI